MTLAENKKKYSTMPWAQRHEVLAEARELIKYLHINKADSPREHYDDCMEHIAELINQAAAVMEGE